MSELPLYCRFCASERSKEFLICITNKDKMQDSVEDKMLIFREEIVDFSSETLPDNICTGCFDALNKSYKFFIQVKQSQAVLNLLFLNHDYVNESNTELLNFDQVKQENNDSDLDNWSDRDLEASTPDESWTSYLWHCVRCNTTLPSMQDLRLHNQECHGSCLELQCVDCNQTTAGFTEFIQHVKTHRPMLSNYCQYCNMKLESPSHIDTHKHNCNSCGQPFTHKTLLYAHLQDYKSNVNKNKSTDFKKKIMKNKSNTVKKNLSETSVRSINKSNVDLSNTKADLKTYSSINSGHLIILIPPLFDTKLQRLVTIDEAKNKPKIMKVNSSKDNLNISLIDNKMDIKTSMTVHDSNDKFKEVEICLKNNQMDIEASKIHTIKEENIDNIENWIDYPLICKYCDLKVTDWGILKLHCISQHKKCFGMKCVDCVDDDSSTLEQFAQHVVKHRPNLINSCHVCHTSIPESDHLFHLQTHRSHFQCTACGQQFKAMRDLRRHDNKLDPPLLKPPIKRRRQPITDDEVVCNTCNFKAKTPWQLKKHKLVHKSNRKRDFTCEQCGKTFLSKGTLDQHTKLHELHEMEPKEICKICNKSFYTVKRLRAHVRKHNLVKQFQCDVCKKFFRTRDNIRSHVKAHMDIRPYACQYCEKRFKQKEALQIHEYQHTGVRPFSCDICCKSFTCWSNCDKHLRRIHGTSLAKATVTPSEKMEIDPVTGKPKELSITNDLQEWMKNLIHVSKGQQKKVAKDVERNRMKHRFVN